jgi:hypothetical protein
MMNFREMMNAFGSVGGSDCSNIGSDNGSRGIGSNIRRTPVQ